MQHSGPARGRGACFILRVSGLLPSGSLYRHAAALYLESWKINLDGTLDMVRSKSFALLMWEFRPGEVRQLAKVTEETVAGPSEARFDVTALRPPSLPGLPLNTRVLSLTATLCPHTDWSFSVRKYTAPDEGAGETPRVWRWAQKAGWTDESPGLRPCFRPSPELPSSGDA